MITNLLSERRHKRTHRTPRRRPRSKQRPRRMAVVAGDVDFSYRVDVSRGVTLAEPIPALKGITLSIPRGGRCAVLGANGAGKSTLLRLLAGRHTPDNGVASILDEPCRSPKLNGRVAYVPAVCSSVRFCSCRLRDGVEVDASMAYRRDAVG